MKTQIIQLEPHDDIVSARDKMGWGQTSRILLIWPDTGRVLDRRLDLILLQRHATTLGAQLAIVTTDPNVRYLAKELFIPVFNETNQAQDSSWRVKNRRRSRQSIKLIKSEHTSPDLKILYTQTHPSTPAWLKNPVTRVILFTIGVLAVFSIGAIILPSATVKLNVKKETQEITLDIMSNPEIDSINLSGEIPARRARVIVEGRSSLPVQGTIQLPDEYASGHVTFTNLTDKIISIPPNSVVRTLDKEPVRFLTTKKVDVPAGPGNSIPAPVQAVEPGKYGNLPAHSLLAIEGSIGLNLAVTNPLPTRGGKDRTAPAPTDNDRKLLYQQILDDLKITAISELRAQLGVDDILFTSTLNITDVLEETYDPADGLPSDFVNLNLRVEFEALTVSGDDIENLLTQIMDANLAKDTSPFKETLEYFYLEEPEMDEDGIARWKIHAIRSFKVRIPETQVVDKIKGQTTKTAERNLSDTLPLNHPPELKVIPDWWPRIPVLPFRVNIVQE